MPLSVTKQTLTQGEAFGESVLGKFTAAQDSLGYEKAAVKVKTRNIQR